MYIRLVNKRLVYRIIFDDRAGVEKKKEKYQGKKK